MRVYEDKDEAYRVRDAIRTIVKSEDGWREKSLTKEDLEALKPYLGDRYYGGIWDADIEEIDLVKKVA